MNRLFALLLTVALPVLAFPTSAQTAELKIGYVNIDKVMRDSQPAVKAGNKLDKEFQTREQDIQKLRKQVRDLQGYLEKEGLTLSEVERSKKQKDLAKLSRDIQHDERAYREDRNQRNNEELAGILDRTRKAIMEIAEKEKFDLILESVVYASTKVDVTDRVLKSLER